MNETDQMPVQPTDPINRSNETLSPLLRCVACYKQFKERDTLVQHIQKAGHSYHEPRCGVCKKHCKCLDALREHLIGSRAKKECSLEFLKRGCSICLETFENENVLMQHQASCRLTASYNSISGVISCAVNAPKRVHGLKEFSPDIPFRRSVVAMDCEMVGEGLDGSLDLCARVCIIDEDENVLLNTHVKPEIPVTDYRSEFSGVHPEDLVDAMPIKLARKAVEEILYNGVKTCGRKQHPNLLVGHSLHHDLSCLGIQYPLHLWRDTAYYPPLLRTSNVCNKLQYLTNTYLGYMIQEGASHDPYEDAVAAMRLYKRMRGVSHFPTQSKEDGTHSHSTTGIMKVNKELEAMELLQLSKCRFHCWCLDA